MLVLHLLLALLLLLELLGLDLGEGGLLGAPSAGPRHFVRLLDLLLLLLALPLLVLHLRHLALGGLLLLDFP